MEKYKVAEIYEIDFVCEGPVDEIKILDFLDRSYELPARKAGR